MHSYLGGGGGAELTTYQRRYMRRLPLWATAITTDIASIFAWMGEL